MFPTLLWQLLCLQLQIYSEPVTFVSNDQKVSLLWYQRHQSKLLVTKLVTRNNSQWIQYILRSGKTSDVQLRAILKFSIMT
jgi:hypothetical protein